MIASESLHRFCSDKLELVVLVATDIVVVDDRDIIQVNCHSLEAAVDFGVFGLRVLSELLKFEINSNAVDVVDWVVDSEVSILDEIGMIRQV